ncbi:NAD(P)-binding protein [Ceratobasidium sp. AG-I]|nr:NAD(P)-binding protein [Ceratobasidium sp. AG-I]
MTRVGIVTGASQGIGKAIALHCSPRKIELATNGIDLAVNDIAERQAELERLVVEIKTTGRKVIAVIGDVSKESEVQAMVGQTVEELGGLDVMVANAGIYKAQSILDVSDEWFDKIMGVNCKGVLYCYRAAAVQMIKQGRGGRIIGASSIWGINGGAMSVSYVASKFAVRAITQTAALEWGQHNITVNAYAPGFVDTKMVSEAAKDANTSEEDFERQLMQGACLPRYGRPEEIASLVGFLASESSSYITGQAFGVNGGILLT